MFNLHKVNLTFFVYYSKGRYRVLGERAVHLKVLQTLNQCLTNAVVCANESVSAVLHSTIFAVTSVLVSPFLQFLSVLMEKIYVYFLLNKVSAFDPSRLNMDTDLHFLLCTLFKDNNVANTFWKVSKSSEIGSIFDSKLSKFPAEMSDVMVNFKLIKTPTLSAVTKGYC
jgi:hypothetical protein